MEENIFCGNANQPASGRLAQGAVASDHWADSWGGCRRVKPVLNFFAQSIGGVDKLQVIEVTESMSVYMRVALLIGLIVALPWIFYQLFSFVGKGLKKAEKRGLLIAIPFATLLFLAGGSFAFFIMLPVRCGSSPHCWR